MGIRQGHPAVAATSRQWVDGLQALKAGEVPVRCVERGPVLDGEGGEMCVHHQGSLSLSAREQSRENLPVVFCRLQDRDRWLAQPGGHGADSLADGEGALKYPAVGANSQKRENRDPSQADRHWRREGLLKPDTSGPVVFRRGIVGVKEEVRVDEDHLCSGPSTCSSSSPTLSSVIPGRAPNLRADTTKGAPGRECWRRLRPRRSKELTTSLNDRPVLRSSAFSRATRSSSSVSVVRTS